MTSVLIVRKTMLVILVAVSLVLTQPGCRGRREINDVSLATVIGVDKGKDNSVKVTVAIPSPSKGGQQSSSSDSSDSDKSAVRLLTAEANDLYDAVVQVNRKTSRILSTSHASVLVLGEDFAASDVSPIMDVFTRNLEFRPNTLVAICKGQASKFLGEMSSTNEMEPSAYLTQLIATSSNELGMCPMTTIHEFLCGYGTLELDAWAPYLELIPAESPEDPPGQTSGEKEKQDKSKPTVAVIGAALFRKEGNAYKLVEQLDREESMAALMLSGIFKGGVMQATLPDNQHVSIRFHHYSGYRKVTLGENAAPSVTFRVRLTSSVEETSTAHLGISGSTHAILVQTLEQEISSLLNRTYKKILSSGSDCLGLGRSVHTHFLTIPQWDSYNWREKYNSTTASFDVKVHVYTYGLGLEPPQPR